MKNISELIFERQMLMFGHVARFYSYDPTTGFCPVATLGIESVVEEDHLARG